MNTYGRCQFVIKPQNKKERLCKNAAKFGYWEHSFWNLCRFHYYVTHSKHIERRKK